LFHQLPPPKPNKKDYYKIMKKDQQNHQRRSIRLAGYDYTQAGAYFVTIVSRNRAQLFGEILDDEMHLNDLGLIVHTVWLEIPYHFLNVNVDAFVIMPNHVHGIIIINDHDVVGARHAVPLPNVERFGKPVPGSIPTIVRSFKSAVTNRINHMRDTPGASVWQRNYYERIIRDEQGHEATLDYICSNPQNWLLDIEFTRN